MRVAVVQLSSGEDPATARDLVAARLADLPDDLDLVVLPEAAMHDFGGSDLDLATVAEPLGGPFVSLLAEHARRLGATIVAGMFEAQDGRLPYNTLAVVGPDGSLVTSYRKVHLYDSFGYRESERLAAGAIEPVTVEIGGLRWGLMTCYDLRFPELARALVAAGADALVVPAAWMAGDDKLRHWATLLTARAIENTTFVVGAAQGGHRYTGHSLVLDPVGHVLAEAGDGDETLVVELAPSDLTAARETNPSLANRRMTS